MTNKVVLSKSQAEALELAVKNSGKIDALVTHARHRFDNETESKWRSEH